MLKDFFHLIWGLGPNWRFAPSPGFLLENWIQIVQNHSKAKTLEHNLDVQEVDGSLVRIKGFISPTYKLGKYIGVITHWS